MRRYILPIVLALTTGLAMPVIARADDDDIGRILHGFVVPQVHGFAWDHDDDRPSRLGYRIRHHDDDRRDRWDDDDDDDRRGRWRYDDDDDDDDDD